MTSVVWFRKDLRLADNKALINASQTTERLLFVFHINPKQLLDKNSLNQAAFFKAVSNFREELIKQGITLNILYGDLETSFKKLKAKVAFTDIYFNVAEQGFGKERDDTMRQFFIKELDVRVHLTQDGYLHGAQDILKKDGHPYQKFTPYFSRWQGKVPQPVITYKLSQQQLIKTDYFPMNLPYLEALTKTKNSAIEQLAFGHTQALVRLTDFIQNQLADYVKNREIPYLDASSHLSRFLRTGEISIREVYQKIAELPASESKDAFIRQLAWRDFYNMVAANHPQAKTVSIKARFDQLAWENDADAFSRWKNGTTGFPLIDAAMRELKTTGFMHNRLRMVVASFLTKDLLIDWRFGEQYFQEQLIDYDSANNIGNWQWVASTGVDSMPYFRIFNPLSQSKKYDAQGIYIKRYVRELNELPVEFIHWPAGMTTAEQKKYNFDLKNDYFLPIIDHNFARKRALDVYKKV
ncbi:deoxyribodipyrimidine photolyase [Weissella oryzae SG25]|uniref:Deoxyribodipyrimidine photolyase n=1 Tax=Weissella oryzae (strain DSM 25784 / JCM 18191 / LMG 30913 / SG25) TaxID=1329250 RepID=A0A069CV19_WEIOS|nr:deoxyribodipyrimidine photo-lyase [Weissella oryzae]GAK31088.1 deoxyribodipyrimidine photolyase [Weissella oryzae SG25]